MADSGTARDPPASGLGALKRHALEHKLDMCMWVLRTATILFTFEYFIPIIGNPYSAYYRVLLANAATSAIRLHQRLPQPTLSKEFFLILLSEDSFHYLFYSFNSFTITPVSLILLPVFLFSLIHFASYSLSLLDLLGQNSWWGARILISLVEFQTRNILRLIAFTEILLMPLIVLFLFMGRAGIFTAVLHFHFLTYRYTSRRNPHTRNMFHELRCATESFANKPSVPAAVRSFIFSSIELLCKFAPVVQTETPHQQ